VPRPEPTIVASANGAAALPAGMAILEHGGCAIDAVEACARIVESDPSDDSVGLGGLPNILGSVELDASIMDGGERRAAAVAAITGYLHPVSVARALIDRLPHVLLVGSGAERFAREIGAEPARLLTETARRSWEERLCSVGESPSSVAAREDLSAVVRRALQREHGTVNFIALDARGGIASAVSTSGWGYKYPGRLGDSPLIGAGNYCDSRAGGATCTGFGELAIRGGTARIAVERLARGEPAASVAAGAIADANELGGQPFSVVVLAADGTHAAASNRAGRTYAYQTLGMRAAALAPRQHVAVAEVADGVLVAGEGDG
jgi:beta-aspartyl-peptidase (threonine type)